MSLSMSGLRPEDFLIDGYSEYDSCTLSSSFIFILYTKIQC
jgi:hypothetical protein